MRGGPPFTRKGTGAIERRLHLAMGLKPAEFEPAPKPHALKARENAFKVKDYRVEGPGRYTAMTLTAGEFIRRFPLYGLPKGFRRIRHYGLLASSVGDRTMAQARQLLEAAAGTATDPEADDATQSTLATPCPGCGGRMIVVETFDAGCRPRSLAAPVSPRSSCDALRHTPGPQMPNR